MKTLGAREGATAEEMLDGVLRGGAALLVAPKSEPLGPLSVLVVKGDGDGVELPGITKSDPPCPLFLSAARGEEVFANSPVPSDGRELDSGALPNRDGAIDGKTEEEYGLV